VTTPNDGTPDASQWLEDVVEPVARRVETYGLGLGLSSAHVPPPPPGGPVAFVKNSFARTTGIGVAALKIASAFAGDFVRTATSRERAQAPAANPAALFLGAVAVGTTATTKLIITNGTDGPYNAVQLSCRGLTATRGGHIHGDAIRFDPPLVEVPARGSTAVTIQVDVSSRVRAGNYVGLVEAAGHPGVWIVVTLDVL
jgi:hypothetical protein